MQRAVRTSKHSPPSAWDLYDYGDTVVATLPRSYARQGGLETAPLRSCKQNQPPTSCPLLSTTDFTYLPAPVAGARCTDEIALLGSSRRSPPVRPPITYSLPPVFDVVAYIPQTWLHRKLAFRAFWTSCRSGYTSSSQVLWSVASTSRGNVIQGSAGLLCMRMR